MEITGLHGSIARIIPGQTLELGRAHFSDSKERTISRRHVSFFIPKSNRGLVQFKVIGVNPFYVHDKTSNEVKIFRSNEKGELRSGDLFCVSANSPAWYGLKSSENCVSEDVRHNDCESNLGEVLESDVGSGANEGLQRVDCGDLDIDPVKDFGFVLMGHEFDSYPKKMIPDIKKWNWFLEEEHKDSEDDDGRNVKHSQRRKRKKDTDNDDEEWTGDSEDETIIMNKPKKAQKAKYVTRSKDRGKPSNDARDKTNNTSRKKDRDVDNEDIGEEEDEDDETLGGFIIDDEGVEEDEEVIDDEDEDEEEEFEDEDEDE